MKIVANPAAHQYCWPGKAQLVRFLQRLGYENPEKVTRAEQSKAVNRFMAGIYPDDSHFRLSFDLPLLMLAESPTLAGL